MSTDLQQLLADNPGLLEQLRAAVAAEPAEPAKPPTLLDRVRDAGFEALGLTLHDVPSTFEVPALVAAISGQVDELVKRIEELEAKHADSAKSLVSEPEPESKPEPIRDTPEPQAGNAADHPAAPTDPALPGESPTTQANPTPAGDTQAEQAQAAPAGPPVAGWPAP